MSLCRQDISIEKVMGKMLDFGEEDWVMMTYLVLDLRSGSSFFLPDNKYIAYQDCPGLR